MRCVGEDLSHPGSSPEIHGVNDDFCLQVLMSNIFRELITGIFLFGIYIYPPIEIMVQVDERKRTEPVQCPFCLLNSIEEIEVTAC